MEEFYGSGIVKEEQIQMEIRLLYGNEIQWAVQTAHEVYEQCVRPYTRNAAEVQQYYDYMNLPNLSQEMLAGRLFLWGAFENGQMCGVSAMQNVGHITALYVRPQYFRRRIGSNLVDRMCNFAASRLQCGRVTVQAAPSAANYFYHTGFTLIQGAPAGMYVPLEGRIWSVPMTQGYMGNIGGSGSTSAQGGGVPVAQPRRTKPEITYPKKKVSARVVLWLTAVTIAFAVAVVTGITVYHITQEGITGGYEMPDPVGDENTETDDGQEL